MSPDTLAAILKAHKRGADLAGANLWRAQCDDDVRIWQLGPLGSRDDQLAIRMIREEAAERWPGWPGWQEVAARAR